MGNAEKLKAAIELKVAERNQVEIEDNLGEIDDSEDSSVWPEAPTEEALDDMEWLEAQTSMAYETGFHDFLEGVSKNPFLSDPELTEDLSEDDVAVLADGWDTGWGEANRELWTAQVILCGKELVECASPEDAGVLLERLELSIKELGELVDYEQYSAFWSFDVE